MRESYWSVCLGWVLGCWNIENTKDAYNQKFTELSLQLQVIKK